MRKVEIILNNDVIAGYNKRIKSDAKEIFRLKMWVYTLSFLLVLSTSLFSAICIGYIFKQEKVVSNDVILSDSTIRSDQIIEVPEKPKIETVMAKSEEKPIEEEPISMDNENVHTAHTYQYYINMDLTEPSYLTAEQINYALKNTSLNGLGEYFIKAESETGVNAQYLIAHAALETGWGKSYLARVNNNLFGFGAYDEYNGDASRIRSFTSKAECISIVANYIKNEYLSEDGTYYNGKNLTAVNRNWATDKSWASKISSIMTTIDRRLSNV